MKAFEEWDAKEYPLSPTIERGPIGRDCLRQRKHAWKAALEWVLQNGQLLDLHYGISGNLSTLEIIEQELEDK